MSATTVLFDIPGIDDLIDGGPPKTSRDHFTESTQSLCICGPDGVGKSILALHAAARYVRYAKAINLPSAVLYFSTDFSAEQARTAWSAFGLDNLDRRRTVLHESYGWIFRDRFLNNDNESRFQDVKPEDFFSPKNWPAVSFFDLQRTTVGDEWQFIAKMLSTVSSQREGHNSLVILDAIEGLELFGGNRDSFGERTTRRGRVARFLRQAASKNFDVLLIVEDPGEKRRLPEQFVTDIVLRLRAETIETYLQRTVEVEKARGMSHIRGRHDYAIRSGNGTRTNRQLTIEGTSQSAICTNPDDPAIDFAITPPKERANACTNIESQKQSPDKVQRPLAHFTVSRSVNAKSRRVGDLPRSKRVTTPKLGIKILDDALKSIIGAVNDGQHPNGSFIVLSGEAGTYKTKLSHAFLANAFVNNLGTGIAILVTSDPVECDNIITSIKSWQPNLDDTLCSTHIIARHLPPHFISSAEFLSMIETLVFAAIEVIMKQTGQNEDQQSLPIHLVIDDYSTLLQRHASLRNDPLLLPTLQQFLWNRGVTAMLVTSEMERPNAALATHVTTKSQNVVYLSTWKVHFFGQRRTAISVGMGAGRSDRQVFELKPHLNQLIVTRDFDLYSGIERNAPERIPLSVELYSGLHGSTSIGRVNSSYLGVIETAFRKLFKSHSDRPVVTLNESHLYHDMASFVELLDDSRLDHTLIVQLDEFWKTGVGHAGNRTNQSSGLIDLCQTYLAPEDGVEYGDRDSDFFYPQKPNNRLEGFTEAQWNGENITVSSGLQKPYRTDRVPYLWDFGFLMARRDLFFNHRHRIVHCPVSKQAIKVGQIWNALCIKTDQFADIAAQSSSISWQVFFVACQAIVSPGTLPFDLDLSGEALSCLVLEMWFSEIVRWASTPDSASTSFKSILQKSPERITQRGIVGLLQNYLPSLYYSLSSLQSVLTHIRIDNNEIVRHEPNPSAVAARHWYSTACVAAKSEYAQEVRPLRLPGSFSTRGDWAIGIAEGSRSLQLGCIAIDVLTSRRMNLMRMHDGLGLPVRDVVGTNHDSLGQLRTALTRSIDHDAVQPILYHELLTLGANGDDFNWLRRSNLSRYEKHRFAWRRWIGRILCERSDLFEVMDLAAQVEVVFQKHFKPTLEISDEDSDIVWQKWSEPDSDEKSEEVQRFLRFKILSDLLSSVLVD